MRRLLGPIAALLLAPGIGHAQAPANLGASCVSAGGEIGLCLASATAGYSLLGHVSLTTTQGSAVPGTASNLGTRVGGGPRLSAFAQASALRWGLPDAETASADVTPMVPALRLGAAAGLFDGFRLMPTVGGFLATDVFGHLSLLFPSQTDGFGGGARAFTLGARIGLFREGFTVPGASISVARTFSGSLDFGDVAGGDAMAVGVDPAVTSVRAAVSKDLFAVELLAGLGWDHFSGDTSLRVFDDAGGVLATEGSIDGSRRVYFASASMTFSLILTLTVEGGFAGGLQGVPGYTGAHDPTSGSAFGSFTARLVL